MRIGVATQSACAELLWRPARITFPNPMGLNNRASIFARRAYRTFRYPKRLFST